MDANQAPQRKKEQPPPNPAAGGEPPPMAADARNKPPRYRPKTARQNEKCILGYSAEQTAKRRNVIANRTLRPAGRPDGRVRGLTPRDGGPRRVHLRDG